MFDYFPTEEEILTDLYNLILDKEVGIKERELYKKAILLIEKENEYYEAVLFQLVPALSYLARQESISSNGCIFMTKISRFTNNSISFYLFDSILKVKVKLLRKINSKKSNYDEKLKKVFFVGKN